MFLFDFNWFLEELRSHENPDKKETIEKYEKNFGPITWDIKDQVWYKEYISSFIIPTYETPVGSKEDFDRELLWQLAAWSFSSEVIVDYIEDNIEFVISVENGWTTIAKKISELLWYQVDRLYKIYIEEQMSLQNHIFENEKEKEEILAQREYKSKKWALIVDRLNAKKEWEVKEKERNDQLSNLMDDL